MTVAADALEVRFGETSTVDLWWLDADALRDGPQLTADGRIAIERPSFDGRRLLIRERSDGSTQFSYIELIADTAQRVWTDRVELAWFDGESRRWDVTLSGEPHQLRGKGSAVLLHSGFGTRATIREVDGDDSFTTTLPSAPEGIAPDTDDQPGVWA